MKIFITGTESFIGKELIRQCSLAGIEVSGVDLAPPTKPGFVTADIRDADIADKIPEAVDAIVHLAALSKDADCRNNAYNCFDVNVMGTLNLIEAARKKRVKQFIFASTEWVYGASLGAQEIKTESSIIDPQNLTSEYALSKFTSECNLRQSYNSGFCPVTILRFGIVYGGRVSGWSAVESLFNDCASKEKITVGCLKTGRHFIHVCDIASAIIKSFGANGFEIINIEADRFVELGEIIEISGKLLGRKVQVFQNPIGIASIRRVSNKKAKDLLGWKPCFDIEAGLKSLQDFFGYAKNNCSKGGVYEGCKKEA